MATSGDFLLPQLNNIPMRPNKLSHNKPAQVFSLLMEGNTLRAASRLSNTPLNSCTELLAEAGLAMTDYQDRAIRNLAWRRIEIDAVWSFAYTRRKSALHPPELDFSYGDAWTWVAIDTETNFVISWMVAGRDIGYANSFIEDLRSRIGCDGQLFVDLGRVFLINGEVKSAPQVTHREISHLYGPIAESEKPDSPTGRKGTVGRIGLRRLGGVTSAFSKKTMRYADAIALHYTHHNFCRIHEKLGVTPAMAAGVTERHWTMSDVSSVWEAWNANKRSAAIKALQQENLRIEALKREAERSTTDLEVERVLQSITDTSVSMSGAQFGAFFEVTTKRGVETFVLASVSGVPRDSFSGFPMPRKTLFFEPIFRGTASMRSNDVSREPTYGQNPPYRGMPKGHLPIRSYLAAPVISSSGNVLGGLFLGHSEPRVFTSEEEKLLVKLASLASLAIDTMNYQQM